MIIIVLYIYIYHISTCYLFNYFCFRKSRNYYLETSTRDRRSERVRLGVITGATPSTCSLPCSLQPTQQTYRLDETCRASGRITVVGPESERTRKCSFFFFFTSYSTLAGFFDCSILHWWGYYIILCKYIRMTRDSIDLFNLTYFYKIIQYTIIMRLRCC